MNDEGYSYARDVISDEGGELASVDGVGQPGGQAGELGGGQEAETRVIRPETEKT